MFGCNGRPVFFRMRTQVLLDVLLKVNNTLLSGQTCYIEVSLLYPLGMLSRRRHLASLRNLKANESITQRLLSTRFSFLAFTNHG